MGEVAKRLHAEADGILAWMVEGLRLNRDEGLLPEPDAVSAATHAYREEMDPLSEFLDDYFVVDPQSHVPISKVRESYGLHTGLTRRGKLGERRFNELMEHRGLGRATARVDGSVQKVWKGIRPNGASRS